MATKDVMSAVPALLREAAAACVLPVFGQRSATPEEKSPGEWVTVADRAAEAFLAPALADLLPGSIVVGEEAASADSALLADLGRVRDVWLVDPLDGTANFIAGTAPFAMMVALLRHGDTVASWMLDPLSGSLASAQRGAGAWLDGHRAAVRGGTPPLSELTGAVLRRFLPEALASHIAAVEPQFGDVRAGSGCAGADYPGLAAGVRDFVLYWRTLPWDHAPGVLFLNEAGGAARRLDGSPYRPDQHARPGLLAARNEGIWQAARRVLAPDQPSRRS